MSAVVENIMNTQGVQEKIVPMPVRPDKCEVVARTLDELVRPAKNDAQELLKNRFLCRGGGLLLVGPTGIGKSSLSMQMMISWALGRKCFEIEPTRPLKSLLIQAENDAGDLAEMIDGAFSGLNVSQDERSAACSRILFMHENSRTSEEFFRETVRPLLREVRPDVLWIDPALSYIGGENNSQQDVGRFLRNQLNPLLTEFDCAGVVVHHTNKPYQDRQVTDFAYLGGGSAEWANWSRAILTLQKTKTTNVFELRAPKRGSRLGWKEADQSTPAFSRLIAHHKEPGTICWVDVEAGLVAGLDGNGRKEDVMKHVPLDRPIAKNLLIDLCSNQGIGKNSTRDLIDALVKEGTLFVWKKARSGSQPEKHLARIAQPLDSNGQEIFTEIFTAVFGHEHLCENENERSSHVHAPFRGGKIDREHLEHQGDQDSLLPVPETNAREDQMVVKCEPTQAPESPQLEPIEELLVKVGKVFLKDEVTTNYMNMGEVAKVCQQYRIKWAGNTHRATRLEELALDFFNRRQQILTDGVKVDYRTDWNGERTELRLSFRSSPPANPPTP